MATKPNFPRDGSQVVIQTMTPAVTAIAVTYDATISASTPLTLNAATTLIEVSAIDKTILMRWGSSSASTSAFDEVINLNTTQQFFVPPGITVVNFIEQAATAILCVVEK